MKKIIVLLTIVGLCVVMLLTKPDKEAHKEAMMKAVEEFVGLLTSQPKRKDSALTSYPNWVGGCYAP